MPSGNYPEQKNKGIKSFRVGEIIDLKPYDKSNYLV